MKYFVYTVIGIVAAAVIGGFFVVGSPREERLRRFDDQRIQHLQSLQWELVNYWQSKGNLPGKLADLNDSLRGFSVRKDPESGQDYEYRMKAAQTFELCAVFDREGSADGGPYPIREKVPAPGGLQGANYWDHGAGQACFERTIDQDFFQPKALNN